MRRFIFYLIRLIVYFLLLFAVHRMLFLLDARKYFDGAPTKEVLYSFVSALKLDIATIGYFTLPTFVLIFIGIILKSDRVNKILRYFHLLITLIYSGLAVSEILLYREWQTKLGYDSLKHFTHFSEIVKTPSISMVLYFTGMTTLTFLLFRWLYLRWVATKLHYPEIKRRWLFYVIVSVLYIFFSLAAFITLRGGMNRFPIGLSVSYYSKKSVLNDSATNVFWHTVYSLLHSSERDLLKPFLDYHPQGADFFQFYRPEKDTFPSILKTNHPNIVFFILESWSADVCLTKGRDSLIAPFFNQLIRQGLYFSNCYAIGHVSDQGVPASLGAFPVIPAFSILTGKQQVGELACISDELKTKKYFTGFLYGGQLDFGNIRGYVYNKGFDEVADVQHFPSDIRRTALGVPDLPLYQELLRRIDKAPSPFFYCGYNVSTHSPYDVPVDYKLNIGGINAPFINTIHYCDSSLNVFFKEAKTKPWYDNTLFVFVADHSHESQIIRVREDKDRYKIPLLLFGPALKEQYCGQINDHIISQLDLVGLLLSQLGIDYQTRYPFSRNPLQSNGKQIAFYNFPGGSGIVTDKGSLTKNIADKNFLNHLKNDTTALRLNNEIEKYLNTTANYLKGL
ncbi:MAG: sulfatase-like hydrolase/transferase [Saprospiraceae bacterium]|nr:sulfatase-like hydrolase/transferase [Saprospiraceae bacterium]